jgi:hypothetical protein
MRFIARKGQFVCVLLTIILSGSLFTGVVFADDEPKTIPAGDEQPRTLSTPTPFRLSTEGFGNVGGPHANHDNDFQDRCIRLRT